MANPDSDQLWIEFLSSLYNNTTDKESEDNEEEEVNDPEFSISEELLHLEDDYDWDFRGKVTDYELDLLLGEEDNEIEIQSVETVVQNNSTDSSDLFTKETVKILVIQWTQHIQLLTQTYFQSLNDLQIVSQNAKQMLNEMNNKFSENKMNSIFSVIHMKPSIDLINRYSELKNCEPKQSMTSSWRTLPVTKENQNIFTSNPDVFIYPWLLPNCGFYDNKVDKNRSKNLFNPSEDHLIALGLEQFKPLFSLRMCYRYIKQLLLPNRTVDQIRTHIKNIKRKHKNNVKTSKKSTFDTGLNPIMFYTLHGKAPKTHSGIIDQKLDTYLYSKSVPKWYKNVINPNSGHCSGFSHFSAKRLKSSTIVSQNDRKKPILLSQQQSPVKQTTNSIVKKYKYLNRLNHSNKQNLCVKNKAKKGPNLTIPNKSETIDVLNENESKNKDLIEISKTEEMITNDNSIEIQKDMNSVENIELICSEPINTNEDIVERTLIEEEVECDDESDLAALMTASSTITTKYKNKSKTIDSNNSSILSLNHNKKEGRKSSAVKQRETTLQLLSFESNQDDPYSQKKEELLIQNYLEKVRKSLSNENFIRFLTLLSEFHQKRNEKQFVSKRGLIRDLYLQTEEFLKQSNVNKDIISEFVLFLSAEEAEECGKMFDFLYWKRFFNFIRKLEIYSSNDSQCLHRLYRSLNQLKQNEENVDKNKIRSTVSRVLNGHSYLMNEFSSLILDEKPSEYLFEDEDFDEVVIDSSDDEERADSFDKMCFETINIPESDEELKYGTNECPCKSCHTSAHNQTMTNHCTSCSIRFIGGRVYLTQNHKKLGLAEIHFQECYKQSEDTIEEDICVESDNELEFESNKSNEKKVWTLSDDKMLLELCRSKVIDDKHNHLSEDVFEEVAVKLSKDVNEVISRFNKLIELFASEQDIQQITTECDQ